MKVLLLLFALLMAHQNTHASAVGVRHVSHSFGSFGLGFKKLVPVQSGIEENLALPSIALGFGYIHEEMWKLGIGLEVDQYTFLDSGKSEASYMLSVLHKNQFLWRLYYPFYLSAGASFRFAFLTPNKNTNNNITESSYLFFISPEVGLVYFNKSDYYYELQLSYGYNTSVDDLHHIEIAFVIGKLFGD